MEESQIKQSVKVHPRTFLRYTICDLLAAGDFEGTVFAHRSEAWNREELPSLSIYMLEESVLDDEETNPAYDDRSAVLNVEILEENGLATVSDRLDVHTIAVEKSLTYKALGDATGELGILNFVYTGMQVGFAEDGQREVAVAVMSYLLEYRMPPDTSTLDYFYTGDVTWLNKTATIKLATDKYDLKNEVNNG